MSCQRARRVPGRRSPIGAGSPNPKIAIVDDDADLRSKVFFALKSDFDVLEGADYDAAFKLLQESELDVLLLGLPIASGGVKECTDLLSRLHGSEIDTLVIVLSSDDKKSSALKVIDAGSYDYFIKPIDTDVLRHLLERAVEKLRIQRENRILREEISRKNALGDLIGATDSMRHVFDSVKRMARATTNVIIRGESGVGKELVARALHDQGPRRARPFISVNCAALPEGLMEAELFGYEKGAFTGAVATKEGRIELAHNGTLFLDEIATLTPALQSKLLRVLEERALTRLGGKKQIKVDFRLVSATNEDLEQMTRDGRFREDLYYRIHVVPIFVPSLRERVEDIPLLVEYFVSVYCAANGLPVKRIADDAMQALKKYAWPGNVRELENAVQRMVIMTDGDQITLNDLPAEIGEAGAGDSRRRFRLPSSGINLDKELEGFEKRWLQEALQQSKQVKAEAARLLGVDRNRLNYLCRKHNL
ncbi:MAG TPA: sigma-54 dependent transcriptional regulator [Candidatus Acidoferrales bacterium]|nr:sigma-54 dependent transcriptional regulator [Candidatus Acidoferrales bacterium]